MRKAIRLELTETQLEQLREIAEASNDAHEDGLPGMVIAQIFPIADEKNYGAAFVQFVPHEYSRRVIEIMQEYVNS